MAALRERYYDSEDFDWARGLGETKPSQKKKGKKKPKKKKSLFKRWSENRQKQRIANNLRNMKKKEEECEKKGMRLSLNGKDCEEITPQPSSTASVNKRASIASAGIAGYLDSVRREEQNRRNMEAYELGAETPSEDEWSDDEEVTQADRDAAKKALGIGGGKRRRKRRRKTRRKKKRKSRRKSRKRRRKRKTKRRR